jgi:CRISPR type III-B/RAMP module-associated protein Cmr5
MSRTIDQKRAAFALAFVHEHKEQDYKEKLLTHILKAPAQILQNSLGQMLAFLLADNEGNWSDQKIKPSGILYKRIEQWLCGADVSDSHPCRVYIGDTPDLIRQIVDGSRQDYIRAQRETLALLGWTKKFAEAWLKQGGAS